MNDDILNAIDEEIARLRQARAMLTDSGDTSRASSSVPTKVKTPRKLSAKARNAIAEAQRKRWAKVKSQKKAAAPAATGKKEPTAS